MDDPRILVCGSRRWPWPETTATILDRLTARHGDRLVIIEGAATGAERAAHRWCTRHQLPAWRHRCHPLAWDAARQRRPRTWHLTGTERTLRILQDEEPRLVIAFHENFTPVAGDTSHTCLGAILLSIPTWLVSTANPDHGLWLRREHFPGARVQQMQARLTATRRNRSPAAPAARPDRGEACDTPPPPGEASDLLPGSRS